MPSKPKNNDYIYDKAPVVEVIAEVLWELKPILGADLAYDPFLDLLTETYTDAVQKKGFGVVERVVPTQVPIEMLAHKPIFRFRKQKDHWPLYQLGPGIFTANITPCSGKPKYEGWKSFIPTLKDGIDLLFSSFPNAEKHLKPKALRLIYINAFGKENGYENQRQFLKDGLEFNIDIPESLMDSVNGEDVLSVSEFIFDLKTLKDSQASLKVGKGIHKDNEAIIVESRITKKLESLPISKDDIAQWFSDASAQNRMIFESYTTQKTKDTFGARKDVK
jgi:uncharacterized protein (TIGR04255 family)